MPALELHQPCETTEPRLRVENILLPGRHRFRLIVVDDDGIESDPVDTLVTIVGPIPRSDVVARAREARGRVFYATGVLLNAQHLDADQLDNHRGLARALAYLHGSGTLAGLEVTWERATGGRGERLVVKPGIALDRLGRIIEVPRDAPLPLDRWFDEQSGARPLPEHVLGQDPTSVFLARLVPPATLPASDARPVRTAREVVVDNRSRRFAYPPAALARWVGL